MAAANGFLKILALLVRQRRLMAVMAVLEMKGRYAGSIGGFAWSVVHPLLTLAIYWFVFGVLFKARGEADLPFIIPFACGFIAWTLFNEACTEGCDSVAAKPYLVTKTVFPTEILPVVALLTSLIAHVFLLGAYIVILLCSGKHPSLAWLTLWFPFLGLCTLAVGIGWIASALNVFLRDINHVLKVILNIWFWCTPVVWSPSLLPESLRPYLWLNPMAYAVEGYRDALFRKTYFWDDPVSAMVFAGQCALVFIIGGLVFSRLKTEFAESIG